MFDKSKYMLDNVFLNIKKIKETAKDPEKCGVPPYKIPVEYNHRPDLIAYHLYNDVSMAEYLAILNDIDDSPEGFYTGREIKYLLGEYKELV